MTDESTAQGLAYQTLHNLADFDRLPDEEADAIVRCLELLERAGLGDVHARIAQRVFRLNMQRQRVMTEIGNLRPFATLLFIDLTWTATIPTLSPAQRRARAFEMIALAGF
jgi:hypothetical protein